MARRVVVANSARPGLDDARRRFTQPGVGPVARSRLQNLRAAPKRIGSAPCTYPVSPSHPGCRYVICEGYFILYEVAPDTGDNATAGDVLIVAVFPPGIGARERP